MPWLDYDIHRLIDTVLILLTLIFLIILYFRQSRMISMDEELECLLHKSQEVNNTRFKLLEEKINEVKENE